MDVERRPQTRQARLNIGRRANKGRDGPRAGAARRAVEARPRLIDPGRVGEHELAAAPEAPGIAEPRGDSRFSHREPPEDQRFDGDELGVGGHVDGERALEPGALEQDRLLRQPEHPGARLEGKRGSDAGGRPFAAVDFLRGRGRRLDCRARVERERDPVGVAAGHAAAGVDDYRLAGAFRARKAPAQAAGLEQRTRLGPAAHPRETSPGLGLGSLATVEIDAGAGHGRQFR